MRSQATALLCFFLGVPAMSVAQAAAVPNAAGTPSAAPAPTAMPSALVQPSLSGLQQMLGTLDLERWKLSRQGREDARRNVDSIRQDLTTTLPPLLAAADAAAGAVTPEFAALRNIDALYDVALRLSATAALTAPSPQAAALDQSLSSLLQGRRSLAERTQADAAAQEHAITDLQGRLRASAAAPVCPTPAPAASETKSKTRRTKPRPKPVTPPTPGPQ